MLELGICVENYKESMTNYLESGATGLESWVGIYMESVKNCLESK